MNIHNNARLTLLRREDGACGHGRRPSSPGNVGIRCDGEGSEAVGGALQTEGRADMAARSSAETQPERD